MKCKECGHNNPDTAYSCEQCGAPLRSREPGVGRAVREPADVNSSTINDSDLDALEKQFLAGVEDWDGVTSAPSKPAAERRSPAAPAPRTRTTDEPRRTENRPAQDAPRTRTANEPRRTENRPAQDAPRTRTADEPRRTENRPAQDAPRTRTADEPRRTENRPAQDTPRTRTADESKRTDNRTAQNAQRTRTADGRRPNAAGGVIPFEDDEFPVMPPQQRSSDAGRLDKPVYGKKTRRTKLVVGIGITAIVILGIIIVLLFKSTFSGEPSGTGDRVAEISQNPDDINCYLVKVFAKEGEWLVFENSGGEQKSVQVSSRDYVIFNVPFAALLPNEPIEGTTFDAYPIVYRQESDGSLTRLDIPCITLNVPQISVSFTTPDSIECSDGSAAIEGTVMPPFASVTVNGEQVSVDQTSGTFRHELKYDSAGTYEVEFKAELSGYSIFRKTFSVDVEKALEPWEIVVIPEDFQTRCANVETSIDVYGTVPAGSTIEVKSDDSGFSLAGEPVVDGSGSFSFTVNLPDEKKNYKMTIVATLPNGSVVERPFAVQRPPVYNDFVPTVWACDYNEIRKPTNFNKQAFKIEGTITEILEDRDYLRAKLTLVTGETIYITYYDHYSQATHLEENGQYVMFGIPIAMNIDDTGAPEVFIWFVQD